VGARLGAPQAQGGSLDWDVVSSVNGLARHLPSALDSLLAFMGEYGVPLASVLMLLATWLWARKQSDPAGSVAGVLWAGLAAGLALVANVPVRALVERPRPFIEHPGSLDLLMDHQANGSFASDHATFTMAVAVGVFLVNRRYGFVAMGLAVLEGFLRMFVGVHYPTDILGGFALGTAVTLLLAPIAMALLTPLAHSVSRSALAPLIAHPRPRPATGRRSARRGGPAPLPDEPPHDLAA
jgi:undecaprenyl-diphosphatase